MCPMSKSKIPSTLLIYLCSDFISISFSLTVFSLNYVFSLRSVDPPQLMEASKSLNMDLAKNFKNNCVAHSFNGYVGLGANLNALFMLIAKYKGLEHKHFILDVTDSTGYFCGKGLSEYFSNTIHEYKKSKAEDKNSIIHINNCTDLSLTDYGSSGHEYPEDLMFPLMVSAAQQFWKFSPEMQKIADTMIATINLFPKPVLAVHVRGGDKIIEEQEKRKNWYHDASSIIKTASDLVGDLHVIKTCVVFGDDLEAANGVSSIVAKASGCHVVHIGGQHGGHNQGAFNSAAHNMTLGEESRCSDIHSRVGRLLAEMHTMASADFFLGSFSSNLPRLIHLLRAGAYGKNVLTSGDVLGKFSWSHNHHKTQNNR